MNYIENMNPEDVITEGRRLIALELSLQYGAADAVSTAKQFESYLKGDSESADNTPATSNTGKPSL